MTKSKKSTAAEAKKKLYPYLSDDQLKYLNSKEAREENQRLKEIEEQKETALKYISPAHRVASAFTPKSEPELTIDEQVEKQLERDRDDAYMEALYGIDLGILAIKSFAIGVACSLVI